MCNISKLVKYILFGDEKHLFYVYYNIKRLGETLGSVLDKMSTWFAVKRLILIIYKTNNMLFRNRMFIEYVVINIQNAKI